MSLKCKAWHSRPAIRILVVLFALAGLVFLYKVYRAQNKASASYARSHHLPIPVRTSKVDVRPVAKMIGGTAISVPSQRITIRPGIHPRLPLEDGSANPAWLVVKSVNVLEGSAVRTGDVLLELEDSEQKLSFERAQKALTSAEAELAAVKSSVAAAARLRDLELASARAEASYRESAATAHDKIFAAIHQLNGKDVVAAVTFYDAEIKQAEAQYLLVAVKERVQRAEDALIYGPARDAAEVAKAESQLKTAQSNLQLSRDDVESCHVKSPVDGFVSKFTASPGDSVSITSSFGEIVKLDPLRIQMDFPQERVDEAAVGDLAEVILDSHPKATFEGKVIGILPQAQTDARVVPVLIELANAGSRIKSGITGFARMRSIGNRVAVPAVAVLQHGPQSYVFLVENGQAHIRSIIPGPVLENGLLEVSAGLAPGDDVVVFGAIYLQDGDRVDTNWKGWTRRD